MGSETCFKAAYTYRSKTLLCQSQRVRENKHRLEVYVAIPKTYAYIKISNAKFWLVENLIVDLKALDNKLKPREVEMDGIVVVKLETKLDCDYN